MFPDFRIIILPNEDLSSSNAASWEHFVGDLSERLREDNLVEFNFLHIHWFCQKNEDDNESCIAFPKSCGLSLSTFYFSVKLQRWNNFYYFADFSALKCLSELLLEIFKKLEPIFAMFISLIQTLF